MFDKADRLRKLPPYLFKEIDRKKSELRAKGVDLIDLGIGDPDLPTPAHIIEAMKKAVGDSANHRYPSYSGMLEFRAAVAEWYRKRFRVDLDPEKEVLTLIGSKEGIAHLPLAFINPGDVSLVPSPGYPVYNIATLFSGGESYSMPLFEEKGFLPDLDAIPAEAVRRAKVMFINYPNNPTAAVADLAFFERVVEFAAKNHILEDFIIKIRNLLKSNIALVIGKSTISKRSLGYHQKIFGAIRDGDVSRARQAMTEHIADIEREFVKILYRSHSSPKTAGLKFRKAESNGNQSYGKGSSKPSEKGGEFG